MHEFHLIKGILNQLSSIAEEQHANKIVGLTVKIGVLSHVSPDHFREQFILVSRGTIAEGARLDIVTIFDTDNPLCDEVILESIEIEK